MEQQERRPREQPEIQPGPQPKGGKIPTRVLDRKDKNGPIDGDMKQQPDQDVRHLQQDHARRDDPAKG